MLQKRKRIVNELLKAESAFAKTAAVSGVENTMRKRASNMKKGAPGGWPTSNLYAEAMNSPQSQKLAVGSMVDRYTMVATAQMPHPVQLLSFL